MKRATVINYYSGGIVSKPVTDLFKELIVLENVKISPSGNNSAAYFRVEIDANIMFDLGYTMEEAKELIKMIKEET